MTLTINARTPLRTAAYVIALTKMKMIYETVGI